MRADRRGCLSVSVSWVLTAQVRRRHASRRPVFCLCLQQSRVARSERCSINASTTRPAVCQPANGRTSEPRGHGRRTLSLSYFDLNHERLAALWLRPAGAASAHNHTHVVERSRLTSLNQRRPPASLVCLSVRAPSAAAATSHRFRTANGRTTRTRRACHR